MDEKLFTENEVKKEIQIVNPVKKKRWNDIIYFSLIGFLIISVIFGVVLINGEAKKCMKNPYIYGANKMGMVECSCKQTAIKQCPALFFFNDTTFTAPATKCKIYAEKKEYPSISEMDLSNILNVTSK